MSKSLRYFFVAAVLLLSARLFAQKQYNCLDWKTNVTVNTYLIQKMHQQYDARRKELAGALTSKKETEEYIRNVRAKFGNLLRTFPPDSPLHPQPIPASAPLLSSKTLTYVFAADPTTDVQTPTRPQRCSRQPQPHKPDSCSRSSRAGAPSTAHARAYPGSSRGRRP